MFRRDQLIFFVEFRPAKTCICDTLSLLRIPRAYAVRLILTASKACTATHDGANLIFVSRK